MDAERVSTQSETGNQNAAGDVGKVSSTLATLTLESGEGEPTSASSAQVSRTTDTSPISNVAEPKVDEVKKQLFAGEAVGGLVFSTGDECSPAPDSTMLQGEHLASDSVSGQASSESPNLIESPKDLKLVIDPAREKDLSGPSANSSIGMSPGARSFAPPFGAKFGDRNNPKVGGGGKGMDLVHEEDDGAVHSGEPSPDAPAAAAAAATAFAGSSWPSSPISAAHNSEGSIYQTGNDLTNATSSSENVGMITHAPRVASSPLQAAAAAPAPAASATAASAIAASATAALATAKVDSSSRPRFRMAFEGKRDEEVYMPTESKFAPTPRVKPRDGLPWGR